MKKYKIFNLFFLLFAISPLGIFGLFNIIIDPYGMMATPTVVGINKSKPNQHKYIRLFKPIEVIRIKPKTIFIGSSKIIFLDPRHPELNQHQPIYNFAIFGTNIEQQKRYFKHALTNQPDLEFVIMGIDFFAFNDFNRKYAVLSNNDSDRLGKTNLLFRDLLNTNLSLDTFQNSINTFIFNVKNKPVSSDFINGMYVEKRKPFNKNMLYHFQELIFNTMIEDQTYYRYQLSQKLLNDYREIINICQQRNIELIVFIPASHATDLEAIRASGQWLKFEQWKRELVNITPVWDFTGYNSITTEPIKNQMNYFMDSYHPTKEVSDYMLNRMLNYQTQKIPHDFGVLLTKVNLESQLRKIRSEHLKWANNNPDIVQLVQDLRLKVELQNKPNSGSSVDNMLN